MAGRVDAEPLHEHNANINALATSETLTPSEFSPTSLFPTEILGDIFVAAMPAEVEPIGNSIGALFAQVCSRWREIASAERRLWSSFSFPLWGPDSADNLLRVHLERSGLAPLIIVVDALVRTGNDGGTIAANRKLTLLSPHTEQINGLYFHVGNPATALRVRTELDGFRGNFANLETLAFSPVCYIPAAWLQSAPRLHTLRLGNSGDLLALGDELPCAQIKTLHFSESTRPHHLRAFVNLTSMTSTQTVLSLITLGTNAQSLPLGRLTTWSVKFPEFLPKEFQVNFFGAFVTPALRTLTLIRLPRPEEVTSLLRRSACHLTGLVLTRPVESTNIGDILYYTPHLETLMILEAQPESVSDALLDSLAVWDNDGDSVPFLTHLTFTLNGSHRFSTRPLVHMLETRATRLNTIDVILGDRIVGPEEVQDLVGLDRITVSFR
ncbi:hypothetical protein B0H11DRAFT_2068889 [Mycena galericulata]|nr:hypothetical protein B0H11DRAFT_2068889 [Mycena galericulata]